MGEGVPHEAFVIVAWSDEALTAVNSLELLGIIYLAIALSVLNGRISRMEGRQEERNHREESKGG
jgi:hypothetical protein